MTTATIPNFQRAAVREASSSSFRTVVKQIPVPQPSSDQILVNIQWSGLCASDKAFLLDEWKDYGICMLPDSQGISGHEGVGVVVAVGDNMQARWQVGDRAGVKFIASTCEECDFCSSGDEVQCLYRKDSGVTAPGTFQEYCVADGRYTTRIPDGVLAEEAGPILCGGLTAYTACKRSNVRPGQWIVIQGAGGGLGSFAIQYARAMGMRVIAVDLGQDKRDLCEKLGAEIFIDFRFTKDMAAEVVKATKHGAHGIVVTTGSEEAYKAAPMLLRPHGTIVAMGLPKDLSVVAGTPPMLLVGKRLNVVGSMVGSLQEADEALDFTARGLPIISKGKLEDLDEWLVKMQRGQIAGRAVLQTAA
ncbi:hypothetical protein QQX98_004078 [Neonectria punicea]|uniref:alcohol dehydrogenase n=1 Tax=Neonectria punicea TaxID=979145 RepID=A0ABR1HBQ6_9HYPO